MHHHKSKLCDKDMFREISDDFISKLNAVIEKRTAALDASAFTAGALSTSDAAVAYLGKHMLSKYNNPVSEVSDADRRQAAIVKWLGVESRNSETNMRIPSTNPSWVSVRADGSEVNFSAWDILFRAKRLVYRLLGDCPSGDALTEFLLDKGGFTGGASTSKRRSLDNLSRKYTERLDATPGLIRLLHPSDIARVLPGWTALSTGTLISPRLVKGNVLFTVPKNAEIDRVACKEPDLNLFCQKAVGNHIRRSLRAAGIDLNDQTRNQRLSKAAYSRSLATIDLSSASDSLTVELVRQLLPPDWFSLVMALRSPKTFIDGASHVNEMISSMGNGYTFELESLVFFVIARSVQYIYEEGHGASCLEATTVGVFGDDLIIDQRHAKDLIAMLNWSGFNVNVTKTFTEGPLYESCGKHYYCGSDVSPFYIRKPMSDVSDLILALNQLRSWLIRTETDLYEHAAGIGDGFYGIWSELKSYVPRSLHGGWDLESRTALVTPGMSRCRLEPKHRRVKRVVDTYQLGMYLARLRGDDSHNLVASDYASVSENSETLLFPTKWTGEWVIRRYDDRARFFGIATHPLYQEMGV